MKLIKLEPSNINRDSCLSEIKLSELAVLFNRGHSAERWMPNDSEFIVTGVRKLSESGST